MPFIKTVTRYDAFLYPNEDERRGRINLYCGENRLYLIFHDPGETLSPNTYNTSNKIGVAFQPFRHFQHFLDLVRNEKPIRVTFSTDVRPPVFVVYCAAEPPGEGEI